MIKAVVFDIGEVVDAGDWDAFFAELAAGLGTTHARLRAQRERYRASAVKGKISAHEDAARLAKAFGKDAAAVRALWRRLYYKHVPIDAAVVALIRRLRRRYRVASFTNVTPISHELRHKKRRYSHFHMNIVSCEQGMCKPEKRFYRLLLRRLRLPAEQVAFIDDKEENLVPARQLGIKVIRFRNAAQLRRDLAKLGVEA